MSEEKTDLRIDEVIRRRSDRELHEMAENSSHYPARTRDAVRKELSRRETRTSRAAVPLAVWIIPGWLLIQAIQAGQSAGAALIVSLTIGAWVVWSLFKHPVYSPGDKLRTLASWFWLIGVVTVALLILSRLGIDPLEVGPSSATAVVLPGVILACALVMTVLARAPAAVLAAVVPGGCRVVIRHCATVS